MSYRLIEADSYGDADVLVAGGGDSAPALALARSGRNRVTLSCRGEDFARARERNRNQLAAAEREGRLKVRWKSNVRQILPDAVLLDCGERLPNDFVFILIGGESPDAFLRKIGIRIVEKSVGAAPAY